MSGKLDGRSYAWTLKNFQSTHIGYRAHRAVIFAIAWHLVFVLFFLSGDEIKFISGV